MGWTVLHWCSHYRRLLSAGMPVHPAQSRNVRLFPSAAAAEAAGFRPCLRCRPETAPLSPAWHSSRATVARDPRLSSNRVLDSARRQLANWLAGSELASDNWRVSSPSTLEQAPIR